MIAAWRNQGVEGLSGVFSSKAEARRDLFGYVEGFYNPRRLHSA